MQSRKAWEAKQREDEETCSNNPELVAAFFECITSKRPGAVYASIMRGPVTANTPNAQGETPLLAAVRVGDAIMVRSLVALGAKVDCSGDCSVGGGGGDGVQRTPLQLAASQGKLGLVKILMELGADDSLVAPDGQIALRLAAENGHREIVDFLPARRAGAWNRWKATHAKEMRRIRSIAEKLGSVLKFLIWSIPKFFLWRAPRKAWECRHRFARWCRREIRQIPKRLRQARELTVDGLKEARRLVKKVPKKTWRVITSLPAAIRIILAWIGSGARNFCSAIVHIIQRTFSLLHTAFEAFIRFSQSVTLQDVVYACGSVLRAVFITLPYSLYSFIVSFSKTAYKVLTTALGILGDVIWFLSKALVKICAFIPVMAWQMIAACGRSLNKGSKELMVCIDPKRM